MLNVILALTIPIGTGLILFFAMTMLGFSSDDFKTVIGAFAPLLSVTPIYTLLQQRRAKGALATFNFDSAISKKEFSINPLAAFLFSFIMWIGVTTITDSLVGLFVGLAAENSGNTDLFDKQQALVRWLIVFNSMPLRVIAATYIGCWIGTRSRPYALIIVIGAILIGTILKFLVSDLFLTEEQLKVIPKSATPLGLFIVNTAPDMLFYMICAALGFWYGQRRRLKYYLSFIMDMLPEETRQTIVEMAHDEATKTPAPGQIATAK